MDRIINCSGLKRISYSAFNRGIETQINLIFKEPVQPIGSYRLFLLSPICVTRLLLFLRALLILMELMKNPTHVTY